MGRDLCAFWFFFPSSPEDAITDQFTPRHLSMLHLSLAKCTWIEMKHGNGCSFMNTIKTQLNCLPYAAEVGYQMTLN